MGYGAGSMPVATSPGPAIAPAVIAAVAGTAGVLLGGVTSALGNYWLAIRRAQHEREGREEEAAHERQARREDAELRRQDERRRFHRETLIALQDALASLVRTTGEAHHHDLVHHRNTGEPWGRALLPEGVSDRMLLHNVEVLKLSVRMEDDQLRGLVSDLRSAASAVGTATSEDASRDCLLRMSTLYDVVVERIGELFRLT